ncbi:MAG: 4-aminobutyrate--2-oxoglutarate transaminase [Acidimicrobiales bacterium]
MAETSTPLPQERLLVGDVPGPRSVALEARRRAALPAGMGTATPVFAARASGAVVEDVDGNRFIDFGAGIAVVNVGHADPVVSAAVAEQAARFSHTCAMVTPYEGYVAVCEELNRRTPGDHDKRSLLVSTGAEAVENAVKIARAATGRPAVIVFDHAFHGRTLLTMTLTAKAHPYRQGFGPLAPEVYRMPMAYPYRWPTGPERCAEEAADQVVSAVRSQVGAEQVACLVIEPIQGEGGFVVPPTGFLPRLADFCRSEGILLVADEVQTGFGRTGAWFASEHEGLAPDLVTTAKGIAAGFPLAGVTGRAEVMDAVHPGGLGGTFGGNPVACAAALASISRIEELGLVARAAAIGATITSRLESVARSVPAMGEVRGRGAMVAIELVCDPATKEPDPARTKEVLARCHREGLIVLKAGTFDNVVRLLPPLAIGDDLLDEGLGILEKALTAVA